MTTQVDITRLDAQARLNSEAAEAKRQEAAFTRFCGMLDHAERCYGRGDLESSVALAQIAARYAYPGNVGLFASPRLERLLVSLGNSLPDDCQSPREPLSPAKRVLHVLSYARPIGGDTRFVWRWIGEDTGNVHSVVVTTQSDLGEVAIPDLLRTSAEATGGALHVLPAGRPLEQARELRRLCRDKDLVILHLFPYDVIPLVALGGHDVGAKTVFVNHSDHTFWIGSSIAHAVLHLREQSPTFLRSRRGLKADRDLLVPIPLAYSASLSSKAEARAALGYDDATVVLLTIASPFKYSSPGREGLLELVLPVLLEVPHAVLLAVGPGSEGEWQEANAVANGRVVALGSRSDTALFYLAADVYVDSVPFSSITSLLEAGSHGLPLLGHAPPDDDLALLGPGAPGLDGTMDMAADAPSYRRALRRLIVDAQHRADRGSCVRARILALHTGERWRGAVRSVYSQVLAIEERGCLQNDSDAFAATSLNSALARLYGRGNERTVMRQLLWRFLRDLRYGARVSIAWRLYRQGSSLSIFSLLPATWNLFLRRAVQRCRTTRLGSVSIRTGRQMQQKMSWHRKHP